MMLWLLLLAQAPAEHVRLVATHAPIKQSTLRLGRIVDDAVARGEWTAFALAPGIAARREAIEQDAAALRPFCDRTEESVLIAAPRDLTYEALHGQTSVKLSFDDSGRVVALRVRRRDALPLDPAADKTPSTLFRIPLDDDVYVFQGGSKLVDNLHATSPDQRHAWDLVIWRDGGSYGRSAGDRNEQYAIWGRPVLAPADGVVAAVRDGVDDNTPGRVNRDEPFGNHIVIDVGGGAFAVLGHLRKSSIVLQPGATVRRDERVGEVGNSGMSTEPHLHFHVQDGPVPKRGLALPIRFAPFWRDGVCDRGTPVRGEIVRAGCAAR